MAIIKGLHAQLIKEQLKNALEKKGYVFFDGNKSYNLNIIGIRNDSHQAFLESQSTPTAQLFLSLINIVAFIK